MCAAATFDLGATPPVTHAPATSHELHSGFARVVVVARIGELLVAARMITRDQCEEALHAQVLWGGRFGTSLIELGFLDLDSVARTLGRQRGYPAALAEHFDAADSELQERLAGDVAERFACVPLMRISGRLYVAITEPLDDHARKIIAADLCCTPYEIQFALAAELRINYQLEKVYRVPRATRFLRAKHAPEVPIPTFEIRDVEVTESTLEIPPRDPEGAWRALTPPEQLPRIDPDRRAYVPTLARAASPDLHAVGRVPLKRLAVGTDGIPPFPLEATPGSCGATLGEATRAIRRSNDRDAIAQHVVTAIAQFVPTAEAALFLIVRGDVAIATAGFSRHTSDLPEVAIPMTEPGVIPAAIRTNKLERVASADLGAIDCLLLSTLAVPHGDLAVVPISISDNVIGVIAFATAHAAPSPAADSITAAAGAAFARLMRDASR